MCMHSGILHVMKELCSGLGLSQASIFACQQNFAPDVLAQASVSAFYLPGNSLGTNFVLDRFSLPSQWFRHASITVEQV